MNAKRISLLCLLCAACSGSSGASKLAVADTPTAAAEALMRSSTISGAKVARGGLPDSSNQVAMLLPQATDPLEPGSSTLMPFNLDNADEATNPSKAVLMQFQGATSHLEVPRASSTDGPAELNLDLSVGSDVCKDLCNRVFTIAVEEALKLGDGSVGPHAMQDVSLDCAKKGDPMRCAQTKSGGKGGSKSGAATGGHTGASGSGGTGGGSDGGSDGGSPTARDDAGQTSSGLLDGGLGLLDAAALLGDAAVSLDFTCADKKHVPASAVCDGTRDCADGSDELGCGDGGTNQFPCQTGGFVTYDKLCNGTKDCSDGFDEMVCVPCTDGHGQYSAFQQCDGKKACADGTDEMGCNFTCTSGEQVPIAKFCDGKNDCKDGSDETPCQFQCGDGTTIMSSKLCDGKADCANGADEAKPMCP
jgi:hypothetical protein